MESGIYKITCYTNNKFYIGSSNNIKRRWQEHKSRLRSNIHENSYLQNCWNKYGEESFVFEILQLVEEDQLFDIEQSYLDKLNAYNNQIGFNQSRLAHGPETDKISKKYIVTTPSGKEIKVRNLSAFCRKNNLKSGGGLHQVARGLVNQCLGYRARYANQTKKEWESTIQRPSKHGAGWKGKYKITFPNGESETIDSLNAFCQKHKLSQGSLRQTCTGDRAHYKQFKAQFIYTQANI